MPLSSLAARTVQDADGEDDGNRLASLQGRLVARLFQLSSDVRDAGLGPGGHGTQATGFCDAAIRLDDRFQNEMPIRGLPLQLGWNLKTHAAHLDGLRDVTANALDLLRRRGGRQ